MYTIHLLGFPDDSVGKESAWNSRDTEMQIGSLGGEDDLEEEDGNPFQFSCLKNSVDRGACRL